jgi:Putative polyhydroxyalkanoic acid system protein (PHA_gran_rgn)
MQSSECHTLSKPHAGGRDDGMFMDCAPGRSFGKEAAMKHAIAHDLDASLAKEAAVRAFEAYQRRFSNYHPTMHWENDRTARIGFSVKGVKLAGSIDILPRAIELDLDVPFLFRPFKGKAIEVIEREVRNWLVKAKNGELKAPAS